MDLHNTVEDTVISRVNENFKALNEDNPGKFCTCDQCRMDVICYTLNRTTPHYIVSHRGASRVLRETFERQQHLADITALIHDGLKKVNHNQRRNVDHSAAPGTFEQSQNPVFNIPAIVGRVLNGNNFAPLLEAKLELYRNGELVRMKEGNWYNPFKLVYNTDGNFSFWPKVVTSAAAGDRRTFEFTLTVTAPGFETLNHFIQIPVTSEILKTDSFTLERTFKLPDLYMFHPGEEMDD